MSLVPKDESIDAFCMRVAGGDFTLYDRYLDLLLSEVYRIYAHQLRYDHEQIRP